MLLVRNGIALFNPHAPLRKVVMARLLANNVHVDFSPEFFRERIVRALNLREAVFDVPYYRLINGEGDELPGITVDRFGGSSSILIVQFTLPSWEQGNLQEPFLQALHELLQPHCILLRFDAKEREAEYMDTTSKPRVWMGAQDIEIGTPVSVIEGDQTYDGNYNWDYSLRNFRKQWNHLSNKYQRYVIGNPMGLRNMDNIPDVEQSSREAVFINMKKIKATAQTAEKTAEFFKLKVKDAVNDSTKVLCVVCRDHAIPDQTLREICAEAFPNSRLRCEAEPGADFPTPINLPKLRLWRGLGFERD